MKITKPQLKQIVEEELEKALSEQKLNEGDEDRWHDPYLSHMVEVIKILKSMYLKIESGDANAKALKTLKDIIQGLGGRIS
jgi:(p)ppGpp synthase/HD superfamily hydrolase